MKLFLFGDSFAVNPTGWCNLLDTDIENFAQNGVGEYKIFKQVMQNLNFDRCIICHTSPWRVHTREHPIHKNNKDRSNNDFMLNDVEYHSKTNKEMKLVHKYLKNYYDADYQLNIYKLLLKELLSLKNTIHITFHELDDTREIKHNYHHIWKQYPGNINHMSEEGNRIAAEEIKKLL